MDDRVLEEEGAGVFSGDGQAGEEQPDVQEARSARDEEPASLLVVGIGASAGGLEALEQFFDNMPADSDLAFVVVQHLSPDYKSLMVELLSKRTGMRVLRAEDGIAVAPNTVYVIPPRRNITIFHGKLYLAEQDHGHGLNLPIDIFFRSLAEDLGERSIGIILSGTGSDGTLGARAIKGAGGMVMAQDAGSAKFDGMPRSAVSTGLVDYILPPETMPEELLKYVKHPFIHKGDKREELILKDEDTLSKILSIIRDRTNIDFTYYKPNTIVRRIERRISINQIQRIEDYVTFLSQSYAEVMTLYKELLIGVTKFFRDADVFDIVVKKIIPKLCEQSGAHLPVRIWSVGCSTGEEAYSLAILFREFIEDHGLTVDVKIFATDIDREAVEHAGLGFYPESIVADVSPERLKRFFTQKEGGYQISEKIRRMVVFALHNISNDPPFSRMDFISCRNLLIYFQPVMQKKVLSSFHFSLNRGGYLLLGSSESIGDLTSVYLSVDTKWKVYQHKDSFKVGQLPQLPTPMLKRDASPLRMRPALPQKLYSLEEALSSVYQTLITQYAPPCIVTDENYELLHVFGDVNKYIKIPAGKASLNILKMLSKDLSTALSTAIYKALKEKKEVLYKGYQLQDGDTMRRVTIIAKPVQEERTKKDFVLLIFEDHEETESSVKAVELYNAEDAKNQRIRDLEQELQYTRENLQATIEELETSNEELQSTNEELIASNEELQSTNEELQSVNEELYTVNSEYQKKIDELTELNNDILNLLRNTNIGTVFLDNTLHIRKYTPAVAPVVNIMDMDIGRPFAHISHHFVYPGFLDDIEHVHRTLVPKQVEVQAKSQTWYLLKILPYRTIENAVGGIVITFIDITERRQFEEQVRRERDLLIRVLQNSPVGELMLNQEGKITFANRKAEELLGLDKALMLQGVYSGPEWRLADAEGLPLQPERTPFARILATKRPLDNTVYTVERPGGRKALLLMNGSPVFDERGETTGAVFSIDDVTNRPDCLCRRPGDDTENGHRG